MCITIFILVVSSAVFVHDVSARAGHVSMGIAVFRIGRILLLPFENLATVRMRQRSTNAQPMTKKVISLKHAKLRVDT